MKWNAVQTAIQKKNRKKIAAGLLIIVIVCIIFILTRKKSFFVLENDSYYLSSEVNLLYEEGETEEKNRIMLEKAKQGQKLYQSNQSIYVKDKKHKKHSIRVEYPFYQKDGAMMYAWNANYQMVLEDFTVVEGREKCFINSGALFDENNQSLLKKPILFLQFQNDTFLNSLPMTLSDYETRTITANSFLIFYENQLIAYEYTNQCLTKQVYDIREDTVLKIGTFTTSYYKVYESLQIIKASGHQSYLGTVTLEHEMYQYFLGAKYNLPEQTKLYQTKQGYIADTGELKYPLPSAPLYDTKENRLFLPVDYALIQVCQYFVNCLPASTLVSMDQFAVYVDGTNREGETFSKAYNDVFLYDGKENYVVFDASILNINNQKIEIAPFSYLSTIEEQKISIYHYDTKEYETIYTNGGKALLEIFDGAVLNLADGTMTRRNQAEELLVKEPGMLPVVK